MIIAEYRGFADSITALYKKAGKAQKAAERIWSLRGRIGTVDDPFHGFRPTKHGESRIKNCVKYDLTGFARLITVVYGEVVILLYCGTHKECETWLNKHRGTKFVVDEQCKVLATREEIDFNEVNQATLTARTGSLIERLPKDLMAGLLMGLGAEVLGIQPLTFASTSDDISAALDPVRDEKQRAALQDTLLLLVQGDLDLAVNRARTYVGELRDAEEVFESFTIPEIVDSEYVQSINPRHPQYPEVLHQFAECADYRTWMSFLHPAQQKLVNRRFNGAARLLGVSGSGKTCVVVRRAVALAERYLEGQILVLTLNEPLADLISSLVDVCCPPNLRPQIEVRPFFQLCTALLTELHPEEHRSFRMTTWKSEEHIDEIWMEFYRCENYNAEASVLFPLHDSLHAQGWRAESYIRDEFDWIRSALPRERRREYLELERTGRAVPLQKEMRTLLLKALEGWERKMEAIGALDVLGVAQRLYGSLDLIGARYRSIIVDECQDFGTVELTIIRRLVAPGEDDLLLAGDAVQRVSTRRQSLPEAGIELHSTRSERLRRNYRNSREILVAASEMLNHHRNVDLALDDGFEVIDPEYSSFEGGFPAILTAATEAEELAYAISKCKEYVQDTPGRRACIAFAGYSLWEVRKWAQDHSFRVLDGETGLGDDQIFVSDLEQTKGFEFDLVCIVNCNQSALPAPNTPPREWMKELSRLYVAMTRARLELCISYSAAPSPFLEGLDEVMSTFHWSDYADIAQSVSPKPPRRTADFRDNGDTPNDVRELSGAQALFRDEAIGISADLAKKLRDFIDGTGRREVDGANSRQIRWRTVDEAARSLRKEASARTLWGPKSTKEFFDFARALRLD